ncbi:MAG: hypothetical protein QM484_07120 [Woeseiaceae bacterium]
MDKNSFITDSIKHTEKPWPQNKNTNKIGKGICERGRKWFDLNLDQVMELFGDIIEDSPEPIDYIDIHLIFVRENKLNYFFDVELRSYIRGFPMPNNYPSPMFKEFVQAFGDVCDEDINNERILRLEIHRKGFFWDLPVNAVLEDEGFYEEHFT